LNAHRKARAVAKKCPDALVLAADTLVFLGGEILGKPASKPEALAMLLRLQGRTHQVVTGVILLHLRSHHENMFAVSTDVRFRSLAEREAEAYLQKINPLDKAGAYAIQEYGDMVVEEISGSYSNVVGLPMERLQAEIKAWDVYP
jgi:septum formation protein